MASRPQRQRFFDIRPGDARFAHIQKTTRRVRFKDVEQRRTAQLKVMSTVARALDSSFSASSKLVHGTHMAYWREFCSLSQINHTTCFASTLSPSDSALLRAEDNILGAFLAFVVMFPRRKNSSNTANYAIQVLSMVRAFFQELIDCRPGIALNGLPSGNLKAIVTGFIVRPPRLLPHDAQFCNITFVRSKPTYSLKLTLSIGFCERFVSTMARVLALRCLTPREGSGQISVVPVQRHA